MKITLFILLALLFSKAFADSQPVSDSSDHNLHSKKELESLEITATVGDRVKVLASHTIYKVLNENKRRRVKECSSSPNSSCLESFVPGNYLIKTVIKGFKKETLVKVEPGRANKINIQLGQTGKVEISASETEQGQNSPAFHKILIKVYGGNYKHKISCSSSLEKSCVNELPVGKYIVRSANSQSKKETPFKITEGEISKVHVIFSSHK